MFEKTLTEKSFVSLGDKYSSAIGKVPPLAHPCNCPKKDCPLGRGKSFCFPCYAEIMKARRAKNAEKKPDDV